VLRKDEATDVGSLINEKPFKRVCSYIEDGLGRSDARLLRGGLPPPDGPRLLHATDHLRHASGAQLMK
jgi:acyl-CoA reductase-like NAD-dependent aldehyde dehydrogenase